MLKKLGKLIRLSPSRKFLIIRVLFLSAYSNLADKFRPGCLRPEDYLPDQDVELLDESDQIQYIKDVAYTIGLADRFVPWENVCRHQAWQAAYLLGKKNIPFNYYVGARKNDDGKVDGHSWVICCRRFISGKCNPDDYKIIRSAGPAKLPQV